MGASGGSTLDFRKWQVLFDALKLTAQASGLDENPHRFAEKLGEPLESLRGMYVTFYQELEYRATLQPWVVSLVQSLRARALRSSNDALDRDLTRLRADESHFVG